MIAKKLTFVLVNLIVLSFFLAGFSIKAAEVSPDAIAIRVMPNNNHTSPLVWYGENIKVKGSPQNLFVDGYAAVRDGRTVYVNAANISGNDFYTNIYIISYNQEAENPTIDIFGQILAHWQFNTNSEIDNIQKQKIIRDVKRLASLQDLNFALNSYINKNSSYPKLLAGSYVAGASVSTWPSWQATLGKELAITMPIDPVNKLGTCPAGFDGKTCWNQADKMFYFNFNAANPSITDFPVYWYKDGVFYAGLETNYNIISAVSNISFNVEAP